MAVVDDIQRLIDELVGDPVGARLADILFDGPRSVAWVIGSAASNPAICEKLKGHVTRNCRQARARDGMAKRLWAESAVIIRKLIAGSKEPELPGGDVKFDGYVYESTSLLGHLAGSRFGRARRPKQLGDARGSEYETVTTQSRRWTDAAGDCLGILDEVLVVPDVFDDGDLPLGMYALPDCLHNAVPVAADFVVQAVLAQLACAVGAVVELATKLGEPPPDSLLADYDAVLTDLWHSDDARACRHAMLLVRVCLAGSSAGKSLELAITGTRAESDVHLSRSSVLELADQRGTWVAQLAEALRWFRTLVESADPGETAGPKLVVETQTGRALFLGHPVKIPVYVLGLLRALHREGGEPLSEDELEQFGDTVAHAPERNTEYLSELRGLLKKTVRSSRLPKQRKDLEFAWIRKLGRVTRKAIKDIPSFRALGVPPEDVAFVEHLPDDGQ
jgi:hypothetical protein